MATVAAFGRPLSSSHDPEDARGATSSSPFHSGVCLRLAGEALLRDPHSLFRLAVARVSSSIVAYPSDELSLAEVADASVDKVLRVEMLRATSARTMQRLLRTGYTREGAMSRSVDALLERWTFDVERHDVLLVGYDGWREVTTIIPPRSRSIDLPGIDAMRATWRLFTAPTRRGG
ncbi:MAG: hypothetical protein JST00_02465 [Deltaproteobacteria bacterium]|nr:hypothetical protein [Deltaproteobacteria bacterium]